mgnify:CR=1 FL=1
MIYLILLWTPCERALKATTSAYCSCIPCTFAHIANASSVLISESIATECFTSLQRFSRSESIGILDTDQLDTFQPL